MSNVRSAGRGLWRRIGGVTSALALAGAAFASCGGEPNDTGQSPPASSSSSSSPASTRTATPTEAKPERAGPGDKCGVVTVPGGDRFRLKVRKGRVACGPARHVFKRYVIRLRRGDAPGNGGGGGLTVKGWACASGTAVNPSNKCTKGNAAFTAKAVSAKAGGDSEGAEPGLSLTVTPVKKHGRTIKLRLHATGHVYEPIAADTGKPIHFKDPAPLSILTTVLIKYGDGGDGGANAGLVTCGKPHVLRRVDDTMVFRKHTYAKADTYKVKVTGYGCGLSKKGVTTTSSVKVP